MTSNNVCPAMKTITGYRQLSLKSSILRSYQVSRKLRSCHLFIKNSGESIYFTVTRIDVGGGWGVRSFKALMLFNTQEAVDQWKEGKWIFEAGAEVSAGTVSAEGSSNVQNNDFSMHVLADGGASATVMARVIQVKINKNLTHIRRISSGNFSAVPA